MLLVIDIGNTSVAFGVYKKDDLIRKWRIVTERFRKKNDTKSLLKKILAQHKVNIGGGDDIIISSVVPDVLRRIKKGLRGICKKKILVVSENIDAPIKNLYAAPRQVGQDRLVNGVAAYKRVKGSVIVIDFGTAVTFDIISKSGAYMGGLIFPGIELSLKSLAHNAALLPHIVLEAPSSLIGKTTKESMKSGLVYGYGALCDGIVRQLKAKVGKDTKVLATGGHSSLIHKHCKEIDRVIPELTFEGLKHTYICRAKRN